MFRNDGLGPDGTPGQIKGWALLLTIFFSEHLYLLVRLAAQFTMSKIDTLASRQERAERFRLRKESLDTTMSDDVTRADKPAEEPGEKGAIRSSLGGGGSVHMYGDTPADLFWARQGGYEKSVQFGTAIIQSQSQTEPANKKEQ
jgi:hypothetical protein